MNILNIAGAIGATALITWLLHFVAERSNRPGGKKRGDLAMTSLALMFVFLFVFAIGWLANSIIAEISNVPVALAVTCALYLGTIVATLFVFRGRRGGAAVGRPTVSVSTPR
jgi:apolipoprotein N-acyltransferase